MTPDNPAVPAAIVLASLIVWGATVLLVMAFCARVSGWLKLARAYPCPGGCPRPRYWLGSLVFRNWFGYNNGIIVSADAHAMHLTAMPVILAPTHPPVAVPWSEVLQISRQKRWFGELFEVQTRALPDLRWGLRRRAFERVKEAAAGARVTMALSLSLALLLPALASAQTRGRLQTHLKKDDAPDVCAADAQPTEACPNPEAADGDAPKTPADGSATTDTTAAAIAPTRHRWADPMGGVHGLRENPPQTAEGSSSSESEGPGGLGGGFSSISAPSAGAVKAAVKHQPDHGCNLDEVTAIHSSMVPKDDKGSFEVTKRVAWKWRKFHAGLLIKRAGSNIVQWGDEWYSAGRICYTHNGHLYKVVGAVGTGDRTFPECLDNDYVDVEKCVPALDPNK